MVRRPLIPNLRNGMVIGMWLLQLWISEGITVQGVVTVDEAHARSRRPAVVRGG